LRPGYDNKRRNACTAATVVLSPRLLFGLKQIEVDRHSHREITGAVRVKLVSRSTDCAFWHEFRLEAAALRIECWLVKIDDTIEQPRSADEVV
jgi:hypothetical protein